MKKRILHRTRGTMLSAYSFYKEKQKMWITSDGKDFLFCGRATPICTVYGFDDLFPKFNVNKFGQDKIVIEETEEGYTITRLK